MDQRETSAYRIRVSDDGRPRKTLIAFAAVVVLGVVTVNAYYRVKAAGRAYREQAESHDASAP